MEYLPTYQQSMGIMAELTTNSPGVDTNAVDSYRAAGTYKYKFTPFLAAHLALRLQEYLPDQHRSRSELQSTWLPGVTFLSSHLRSVFQGALAVEEGGNIGVQISMTTVLKGDSIAEAVPQDDYYYLMSSN